MANHQGSSMQSGRNSPPATTPEGRENQMIALAMNLAEKRMRAGTASAQEVTHFLKLGSVNARYEREILKSQKELMIAKTEQINQSRKVDELYADAIAAFTKYSGNPEQEEPDDRDDRDRYED